MTKRLSDYKLTRFIVYIALILLWFIPELDILPLCGIFSLGIILLEITRTGGSVYASGFSIEKTTIINTLKTILIFIVTFSLFPILFLLSGGSFVLSSTPGESPMGMALMVFSYAFWEELIFRGSFFKELIENNNGIAWTIVLSLLFAVAHITNPNVSVVGIVNIFVSGIMFSMLYIRTNSIYPPTIFHFLWNWTQSYVFGFSTSGYEVSASIFTPVLSDSELNKSLFGSSFGLEGSVLAVIVLICAILLSSKLLKPLPMANSVVLRRKFQ